MNLTHFVFYKDTPFTDLKNTIFFKSNNERDLFFSNHYEKLRVSKPFNFIKDRLTVRIEGTPEEVKNINYCSFISDFDNIKYFAFIPEYRYINDNVIEFNLLIDVFMTFCQGKVLEEQKNLTVLRQHLPRYEYMDSMDYLKNNGDVLECYSKKYVYFKSISFSKYNILIESSTDLSADFGTEDNPKMIASQGCIFDDVSSPINLYICTFSDFDNIMDNLKKFPWITQNFKKISMIPHELLNTEMNTVETENVSNPNVSLPGLKRIKKGVSQNINKFLNTINLTEEQLYNNLKLDIINDRHILRSGYITIELDNFLDETLTVNPSLLNEKKEGLRFYSMSIAGFENIITVYPLNYKTNVLHGDTLAQTLTFNQFDDVPISIDSYSLAMSKSAHQREFTKSNLITNKFKRATDKGNDITDRFVAAAGILSNVNPLNIGKGLVDEHEYYRQEQAQQLDLKLTPNETTSASFNNSLLKKNGYLGYTLRLSAPTETEMKKIKRYYKLNGYDTQGLYTNFIDLHCMTICNYIQAKGNLYIPGVERSLLEMLKIQLENGIRLWHNKDIENPFTQDILLNKFKE